MLGGPSAAGGFGLAGGERLHLDLGRRLGMGLWGSSSLCRQAQSRKRLQGQVEAWRSTSAAPMTWRCRGSGRVQRETSAEPILPAGEIVPGLALQAGRCRQGVIVDPWFHISSNSRCTWPCPKVGGPSARTADSLQCRAVSARRRRRGLAGPRRLRKPLDGFRDFIRFKEWLGLTTNA
jgi:hypothetical protein